MMRHSRNRIRRPATSPSLPFNPTSNANVVVMMNASKRCNHANGWCEKGLYHLKPNAHSEMIISNTNTLVIPKDIRPKISNQRGGSGSNLQSGTRNIYIRSASTQLASVRVCGVRTMSNELLVSTPENMKFAIFLQTTTNQNDDYCVEALTFEKHGRFQTKTRDPLHDPLDTANIT